MQAAKVRVQAVGIRLDFLFPQRVFKVRSRRIVRGAGHAFGTTPEQSRRTYAEELSFLAQVLDLKARSQ